MYDVDVKTVCFSCQALEMVRRDDKKAHEQKKPVAGVPEHDQGRIYTVREIDDPRR